MLAPFIICRLVFAVGVAADDDECAFDAITGEGDVRGEDMGDTTILAAGGVFLSTATTLSGGGGARSDFSRIDGGASMSGAGDCTRTPCDAAAAIASEGGADVLA